MVDLLGLIWYYRFMFFKILTIEIKDAIHNEINYFNENPEKGLLFNQLKGHMSLNECTFSIKENKKKIARIIIKDQNGMKYFFKKL